MGLNKKQMLLIDNLINDGKIETWDKNKNVVQFDNNDLASIHKGNCGNNFMIGIDFVGKYCTYKLIKIRKYNDKLRIV
jgi:hypothetical protein